MSCPGLHCSCCAGGAAVPVVPMLAFCGLAWVAEHLVEVAIVSGTCGVLAVAAVVALMRWQDRRQARHGPLMVTRAEIGTSRADLPGEIRERLTDSRRPAIAPPQTVITGGTHIWLTGLPDEGQAAAIRKAISGQAGDAITEREKP